jgi:membrane-associated phospholipid phosphatase
MFPQLMMLLAIIDTFLAAVKQVDNFLFTQINSHFTNSFLDTVLPFIRNSIFWIPLYLFLLVFILVNFGNKGWLWITALIITVTLTDQISSHVIKILVQRPRPCSNTTLQMPVRLLLSNCSGGYSFTSSHATNHFGVATFIAITLKQYLGKWQWLFIVWAAVISYAQIYVGVHYPFDVLCGALLGSGIGYKVAKFFLIKFENALQV